MKNIDYLELFFKKHNLSGRITVKYSSSTTDDDYMSDIVFENGDVININDVIFDIDSDFPSDVAEQWMNEKRKEDISLVDWIQTNTHYLPKDLDLSSVKEYQVELEDIVDGVKKTIDSIFQMEIDEEDSDYEGESEDE